MQYCIFVSHYHTLLVLLTQLRIQGSNAFIEGSLIEAIKLYTMAIELNPTDHQTFADRSATYSRLNDTDRAMKDIRSILLIKPECSRGYYQKGAALMSLERCEDAVSVFKEGLAKYPHDSALSTGLAYAKEYCLSKKSENKGPIPTVDNNVETQTVSAEALVASTDLEAVDDMKPISPNLTGATGVGWRRY